MSNQSEVLIVGAGPTGLMLAAQLAINDINFRIIDKNAEATKQSRALVIQARTLEILDQLGLVDKFIEKGKVTEGVNSWFNGKQIIHIEMKGFEKNITKFPFVLMLEQSKTEKLLIEFLEKRGVTIERNTELVDFAQYNVGVTVNLRKADNSNESAEFKYLVGTDGSHSIIREKLGMTFKGSTYPASLYVLDCKADLDQKASEINMFISDKIPFAGFFPMTNERYRVIGILPGELEGKKEIKFDEINHDFANKLQAKIKLYDPKWLAVYHAHHRFAPNFQVGRCFIAGDAAHIHSPVGGQGMNTGIQDAYNLGWKLSLVLHGKAQEKLLSTYSEERIKVAEKLVHTTDKMFHLLIRGKNKNIRKVIIPIVMRAIKFFMDFKKLKTNIFKIISEVNINYRQTGLTKKASKGSFSSHSPMPGDRAPCSITSYLEGKKFHLIFFGIPQQSGWFKIREFADNNIDIFSVHFISPSLEKPYLLKEFGIVKCGIYLIRPDMYVAYRSNIPDYDHFINYLKQYFII